MLQEREKKIFKWTEQRDLAARKQVGQVRGQVRERENLLSRPHKGFDALTRLVPHKIARSLNGALAQWRTRSLARRPAN